MDDLWRCNPNCYYSLLPLASGSGGRVPSSYGIYINFFYLKIQNNPLNNIKNILHSSMITMDGDNSEV